MKKTIQNSILIVVIVSLLLQADLFAQGAATLSFKPLSNDTSPLVDDDAYPQLAWEMTLLNNTAVPLTQLNANNLAISENGHAHTDFSFTPFVDDTEPLSLMLVLDISSPMQPEMNGMKTAVQQFFDSHITPIDETALITAFKTPADPSLDLNNLFINSEREIGFTHDKNVLLNLLNSQFAAANSSTLLYDSTFKAVRLSAAQASNGRHAVILVTNGADRIVDSQRPASLSNSDVLVDEARNLNVPIFTIAIGNQADTAALQKTAILTGGRFIAIDSSAELAQALADISDQLRQRVRIELDAVTPADDMPHDLKLQISTSAGDIEELLPFVAKFPITPQFDTVLMENDAGEQVPFATVTELDANLRLLPAVNAHQGVQQLSYWFNDDEAGKTAVSGPPWQIDIPLRILVANNAQKLTIEAIGGDASQPVSQFTHSFTTAACTLRCRLQSPSQSLLLALAALLLAILLLLIGLLLRRSQTPALLPTAVDLSVFASGPQGPPTPMKIQPAAEQPIFATVPQTPEPQLGRVTNESSGGVLHFESDIRIGKDPYANISLTGAQVDNTHALIKVEGGQYVLVISSKNFDTWVNGQKETQRVTLNSGDIVRIGEHMLRFELVN